MKRFFYYGVPLFLCFLLFWGLSKHPTDKSLVELVEAKTNWYGGSKVTFITNESFNATGYDYGTCGTGPCWTETLTGNGTIDEDYAPGLNNSTYALQVADTDADNTIVKFTPASTYPDTIYCRFYFQRLADDTDHSTVFGINNVTAGWGDLALNSNNPRCETSNGTLDDGAETILIADGEVVFWVSYTVGSGANATITVYVDEASPYVRPGTASCSSSDGDATTNIQDWYTSIDDGNDWLIDEIVCSEEHWDNWQ